MGKQPLILIILLSTLLCISCSRENEQILEQTTDTSNQPSQNENGQQTQNDIIETTDTPQEEIKPTIGTISVNQTSN